MLLNLGKVFINAFFVCGLFAEGSALAQTSPVVLGELTTLRQTTVNGEQAFAGLTLSKQTQIITAPQGLAFLNFGGFGQLELGADTNFTIFISPQTFSGNLQNGRAIINAPANVAIIITLSDYRIINDPQTASALRIETDDKRNFVKSFQGKFKVLAPDKVLNVMAGEEIWLTQDGQHQRRTLGQVASNLIQHPLPDSQSTTAATTLTNLISTSIHYSFYRLIDSFRFPSFLYETTVSCSDKNNLRCRPYGRIAP